MVTSQRRVPFTWRRMLALNLLISAIVTAFMWSFQPQVTTKGVLAAFSFCFGFTTVFGLPASWVLSRLGIYGERLSSAWRWLLVGVQVAGFTVLGVALGILTMQQLGLAQPENFWRDYVSGLRLGLVVALTVGFGFALWETRREELVRARRELHERELAEAHVKTQLAEARLASLESRLRPHFLFNTLNSIAALIPENPRLAENMVERLAALLRFTLDAGERRLVPLSVELEVVKHYLEIERARFGSRLRVSIEVPGEAASLPVPPLSVQTLVENAVKHAVAPCPEGGTIRVWARLAGGDLVVGVEDDGPGFDGAQMPPGHGLANLRERLVGLFGERARLELGRAAGATGAAALLRLPSNGEGP